MAPDEFPLDDTPAETTAARRYAASLDADPDSSPVTDADSGVAGRAREDRGSRSEAEGTAPGPDTPPARADTGDDPEVRSGTEPAAPQQPRGADAPPSQEIDSRGLFRSDPATSVNPFARPGSSAATQPLDTPIPRPVLPTSVPEGLEETTHGRRMGPVAVGPTPAPRRSAASSLTPPEPDERPQGSGSPAEPPSWFAHHRKTLLTWGIGAIVVAILLATVIYLFQRTSQPEIVPSPGPSTTDASPEPSESPTPEATVEDLLTEEDANQIVEGASWVTTATVTERSEFPARAVCLSTDANNINPVIAMQRTLGTSQEDQLAAMHQIETFASDEAAQDVMSGRINSISSCGGFTAYLVDASSVEGLGDDGMAFTIAYENDPLEYHTLLMVRNGRSLTMVDVFRHGEPVSLDSVISGLMRSVEAICEPSDGTCPGEVSVVDGLPPAGDPPGWLEPIDIQRLRAGSGMWTANSPTQVGTLGTTCENLPLATESGPDERAQRTYILTQDAEAPPTFGLDELLFTFSDEEGAAEFAEQLITNVDGCEDRLMAADVTEIDEVEGQGAGGSQVSSKTYLIELATSDDESVFYQLAIGTSGQQVTYLMATVTEDYRFTDEQFNALALRAAQRATQA